MRILPVVVGYRSAPDILAYGILDAFGFDDEDHLYHFEYLDDFGRCYRVGHEAVDDGDDFAEIVLIKDVYPRSGARFQFVFDYCDWWEFELQFESLSEQTVLTLSREGTAPEQYPNLDEGNFC